MKKRSGNFWPTKTMVIALVLAVLAVALVGFYIWSQQSPAKTTMVTPQPSASVPMGGHGSNTTENAGPSHDATPSAAPTVESIPPSTDSVGRMIPAP